MNLPARVGQPLTGQENHVLALVAHGLSNAEIGARVHLAEETIKTHMGRILRKLGARNRAHAVTIAFCKGLLELPKEGDCGA